MCLIEN